MQLAKKILKRLLVYLIELYFRFRHLYAVWFYILNRFPRKLFKNNLPQINAPQERLVAELRETGITTTHLNEMFPGEDMLNSLQKYTNNLRRSAEIKTGKTFLEYLWDVVPVLDINNPFVKISLSDKILDVVNSYLEMYGKFYYLTLNVTLPVKGKSQAFASQRWHRDPEDKKMLKLFIYLSDVDENSGPFIYIPRSKYGLRWGDVFPQKPPRGYYPKDGGVEEKIPASEILYMTGKAGTMILCDTSGLHKGGYALDKERVMFTGGFRTQSSVWQTDFKYPSSIKEDISRAGLNDKAKFALRSKKHDFSSKLLNWLKGRKV